MINIKFQLVLLIALLAIVKGSWRPRNTERNNQALFNDDMKDALDDMQAYFEGKPAAKFDQSFYYELLECFEQIDAEAGGVGFPNANQFTLYESQVAAWRGIYQYWLTNATNVDYLGRPDPWGQSSPALEGNLPPFDEYYNRPNVSIGRYGILTYGKCNYVSNIAYYRSVTKMCKYPWSVSRELQGNQKKMMATLAVGSAFMHQSYTYVGARFDNLMISMVSYLGHQMMVENLPGKSSLITELQRTKRSMNSSQVVANITDTIASKPVKEWGRVMDLGDFPHSYFTNFGAIVCNFLSFVYPGFITEPLIRFLADYLLPAETPADEKKWLTDEYLPEIVRATHGNKIPLHKRVGLLIRLTGVLTKLIFAFTFQEQFLPIPGFDTHPVIYLGGFLIPFVNQIADMLTGFEQSDKAVVESVNIYPGHQFCKHDQGHAIWHEVSANGLLDLVYLCDYMNSLVLKYFN